MITPSYFRTDPFVPTTPTKIKEWTKIDHDDKLDLWMIDLDITFFACISNSFVMVLEGIFVSQDPTNMHKSMFWDVGVSIQF